MERIEQGEWQLLEHLEAGALIASADGLLLYANPAARRVFGLAELPSSLPALFRNAGVNLRWTDALRAESEHRLTLDHRPLRLRTIRLDENHFQLLVNPVTSPGPELLTILEEAAEAIAGTFEQEQVLSILADYVQRLTDCVGCTVFQLDDNQNEAIVLLDHTADAAAPLHSAGQRLTTHELPFLETLFDPRQTVVNDGYRPVWTPPRPTTILHLPIYLHDDPFGFISVVTEEPLPATRVQLLRTLITQAGVSLENVRMFVDTYERERFFNALARVSLATSATLDLDTVLNLICQESLTIFEVDGIYIWQREEEELVGIAAQGFGREAFIGQRAALTDPVFSADVTRNAEPTFINEFSAAQRHALMLPQPEEIQAVLGIPLRHEETTIGALILADTQRDNSFGQRDISHALQLGGQAAIAIQNAQLVRELRELNEQLDERVAERTADLEQERDRVQFLLRVSTELAASLDEDRVLTRSLEMVNEIVNATEGTVLLTDGANPHLRVRARLGRNRKLPPGGVPSRLKRGEGLAGWVMAKRRSVVVNDVQQDPRWIQLGDSTTEHHAALAVPLFAGDDVIGVVIFLHEAPGAFTNEQLRLVDAVAHQVANAIGNAQLYFFIQDQAEQIGALLREEQKEAAKNEAILESMADGLLVADEQGQVVLANQAIGQILNLQREEMTGRSIQTMLGLYGPSVKSWLEIIDDWARNSDRLEQYTFMQDELQIEDRFINIRLSPVFSGEDFLGTVSIFRDITKEREAERSKSEFVSNVSHELRTPMTSIKGYTDLMLMGAAGEMSEAQRNYLQVIKNNASRLKLLVDDLLDISRIETGKTTLNREMVDLSPVIAGVVNGHLRGRIVNTGREIAVRTEIPEDVPHISADREKVTRILTNLVDNAFNYTRGRGEIAVTVRREPNHLVVDVTDTGIGISESSLDKIFDRFYRSEEDAVQMVPGTGLGLAIVQSLVEMHGGELKVQSKVGQGSTFSFSLPLDVNEDPTVQ